MDVVVASEGSNDVTVLLGDGRGGLRQGASVPAGANPAEIFVGDFDRDGHPDLAIANHDTSFVTILLGDGQGGFRPASGSPLTVHSKPHPHTVDGCDANGDGNLDLVIDSWEEERLTLLLGDGKGGFQTPGLAIEVGRKPYRNLKLRDVNGDGKCDIVAPSYGKGVVTILLGDGRGHFKAGDPIPAGPAPFTVDVGDLNHDGFPDLAFSNYSGQITDPRRRRDHVSARRRQGPVPIGPAPVDRPRAVSTLRGRRQRRRIHRRGDRGLRQLGSHPRIWRTRRPVAVARASRPGSRQARARAARRPERRSQGRRRRCERRRPRGHRAAGEVTT